MTCATCGASKATCQEGIPRGKRKKTIREVLGGGRTAKRITKQSLQSKKEGGKLRTSRGTGPRSALQEIKKGGQSNDGEKKNNNQPLQRRGKRPVQAGLVKRGRGGIEKRSDPARARKGNLISHTRRKKGLKTPGSHWSTEGGALQRVKAKSKRKVKKKNYVANRKGRVWEA